MKRRIYKEGDLSNLLMAQYCLAITVVTVDLCHTLIRLLDLKRFLMAYSKLSTDLNILPKFVKQVPQKYKCVICHGPLRSPVQTVCGHRVDEECVVKWISEHGESGFCPAGEEDCQQISYKNVHKDTRARIEISKLLVYCRYRKFGCQVTPSWKDLQEHLHRCKFKPVPCFYKSYGCSTELPQDEIKDHEKSCCFSKQHANLVDYEQSGACSHRSTGEPSPCVFHPYGCEDVVDRENLEQHYTDAIYNHCCLIVKKLSSYNGIVEDITKQADEQKDIVTSLKRLFDRCFTDSGRVLGIAGDTTKKLCNLERLIKRLAESLDEQSGHMTSSNVPSLEQFDEQAAEVLVLQESVKEAELQLLRLEGDSQIAAIQELPIDCETKIKALELKFTDYYRQFHFLETTSYNGSAIWIIKDVGKQIQDALEGRALSLYSQPFYTSYYGYKMCGRIYLGGDGIGKGSHVSLYFVLMQGEYDALLQWPFRQRVTLSILDQVDGLYHLVDSFTPDSESSSSQRPTGLHNVAIGCPQFCPLPRMRQRPYIVDDKMYIKISVDTTGLYDP